jgi:hypothetical protein
MLGDMKESQLRQFEYNNMLVKNQTWEYSPPVYSEEQWQNNLYEEQDARYLAGSSNCLKVYAEKMRQGEFPDDYNDDREVACAKGIDLTWDEDDPLLDHDTSTKTCPHWEEFAKALKQFTPAFGVLPDGCETYFILENIQLAGRVQRLLKDALMHKPFQKLSFVNKVDARYTDGMSVDAILDIVDNNKHLRKLRIGNNLIGRDDIAKICSAVCRGSIVELDLYKCFAGNGENGLGDDMITSLLATGGLAKLKRLVFHSNGLQLSTITTLANFLATNPPLQTLDLVDNMLDDDDTETLANAIQSNTTLRGLGLHSNAIGDAGKEAFRLVLHGDDNLNSIADSNHSCSVFGLYQFDCWNVYETWKNGAWHLKPRRERSRENRARKLYRLLSERNKSMSTSNVQHFDEIDVKILPFMLKAVQTYASVVPHTYDRHRAGYCRVEPLSIVYEVMRKWDKVFPLYTDGGNDGSI